MSLEEVSANDAGAPCNCICETSPGLPLSPAAQMASPGPFERTDSSDIDRKPAVASPFVATPTPGPSVPKPASIEKAPKAKHDSAQNAPVAAKVGSGAQFNSMLSTLINYLKSNHPASKNGSDLAVLANVRELDFNEELQLALRAHDRIEYIVKTDLYAYKPEYLIRNKLEALQKIQAYGGRGGMPMKKLEESWKDAKEGVEELERDGRVLCLRTGGGANSTREPQIKMVFFDEVGVQPPVDEAFRTAWQELKTPRPDDLDAAMAQAGISRMKAAEPKSPAPAQQKQKKKPQNRRMKKFTNVHMRGAAGIDLSRDYHAPGRN